jgi:hypothetical protein
MAIHDNLSELAQRVRASREALQASADRVAALQRRLRTDAPTIVSLDKLARAERSRPAASPGPAGQPSRAERFEGDIAVDAWEISLINEEG